MLTLQSRSQAWIGLALILLMAVTRGHHFASIDHLPSASWAVFFLAGVYLKPLWSFPLLLLEAFLLDFAAVTWGGVSNFCISPAYVMLVPAYAALWGAGRFYARLHQLQWHTIYRLAACVLVGALICQVISSGSFYYFSGRFAEPTLMEFIERLVKYTPRQLEGISFYIAIAYALQMMFGRAITLQKRV